MIVKRDVPGQAEVQGRDLPGKHDPLVEQADFDAAQAIQESRQRQPDGDPGRTPSAPLLLSGGMLRCGECGAWMSARSDSYVCRTRQLWGECSQPSLKRLLVDPSLTRYLDSEILDLGAIVRRAREASDRHLKMTTDLAEQATHAVAHAEDFVNRVESDYRSGDLTG
jgi:Recombinase zinc beta ribbon domain